MISNFSMRITKTVLVLSVVTVTVSVAHAQNRGQYLPGVAGLNSGIQAPPGVTYANLFSYYSAGKLKGNAGQTLPVTGNYTVAVDQNLIFYTTKHKFLGADYGATLDLMIAHGSVTVERFGSAGATGFGDLYAEPINLGWHKKKADIKVAYGFVAPTGTGGVSSDYWGHDITVASTFYLNKMKTWQFSVNTVTEFHQKKRHQDLKVGNNTNLEYGLGKTFIANKGQQLWQLGLVGYAEWQFTDDTGTAANPALARLHDRVFAAGPEVGLIIPKWKASFAVRFEPEFGAHNRTQGHILTVGFVKSF